MTAEVGTLNRLGVALAADSAVSVRPEAQKVYTSADKLFQLSDEGAVGIMVYGNARFLGMPWETIIKMFRSELGSQTHSTTRQYADALLHFIGTQKRMFPESVQEESVRSFTESVCAALLDDTFEALLEDTEKEKVSEDDLRARFTQTVRKHLDGVRATDWLDGLPDEFPRTLRKKYRAAISDAKKRILKDFPLSQSGSRNLTTLVVECLCRRGHKKNESGVVVAGFGDDEHCPSLYDIRCHGMVANRPLYYYNRGVAVGPGAAGSAIVPFAQPDVVATFMDGIDPSLKSYILTGAISLLAEVAQTILDDVRKQYPKYSQGLEKRVSQALVQTASEFIDRVDSRIHEKHSGPVVSIVGALPKDELAAIAESLVNVTKFKRRVSPEQETVAGPIDVAVITKGDGFVWIRRKQYFKPELNPRFLSRYNRGRAQ